MMAFPAATTGINPRRGLRAADLFIGEDGGDAARREPSEGAGARLRDAHAGVHTVVHVHA